MIIGISGEEKTRKTGFAYSQPLPIVGFQFDTGFERSIYGTAWDLFKGCEIELVEYTPGGLEAAKQKLASIPPNGILAFDLPSPIQLDPIRKQGFLALWQYCIQLAGDMMRMPNVPSLVFDTMTFARKHSADAYLEGLQEKNVREGTQIRERLQQIEYGHPYGWIEDIYKSTKGSKKNMVAVHHLDDERVEGVGADGRVTQRLTGKRILEGHKKTVQLADVMIRFSKKQILNPVTEQRETVVEGLFESCGYNLSLEGSSLINPTWDMVANRIMDSLDGRIKLPLRNGGVTSDAG